jgi:hypothetical protein
MCPVDYAECTLAKDLIELVKLIRRLILIFFSYLGVKVVKNSIKHLLLEIICVHKLGGETKILHVRVNLLISVHLKPAVEILSFSVVR